MRGENDGATVAVIGLGYVGLPLSIVFTNNGHDVVGIDIDTEKIERLREGESHVDDITDEEVQQALDLGFTPEDSYDAVRDAKYVVIAVPTPLTSQREPDTSIVQAAAERVADHVSTGTVISLESTVYPGATEEAVVEVLEDAGFRVGTDVHVVFSPERISPGRHSDIENIPKLVGGYTERCTREGVDFYESTFTDIIPVSGLREAEFAKLTENIFRAVNVGFVNELSRVADTLEVDIWEAIDAASTKPFGYMPFYPGPGVGGHCIPVDPEFLSYQASMSGVATPILDTAIRVNRQMPAYATHRIKEGIEARGCDPKEADVLVLGVSYKPNIADLRQSPSLDVLRYLDQSVQSAAYHDPLVPSVEVNSKYMESTSLDRVGEYDCIVIATPHDEIDFTTTLQNASYVFDLKNFVQEHEEFDVDIDVL